MVTLIFPLHDSKCSLLQENICIKFFTRKPTFELQMLPEFLFFFFSLLFYYCFKPRLGACVDQAAGASSANEIRLEQLQFVKNLQAFCLQGPEFLYSERETTAGKVY